MGDPSHDRAEWRLERSLEAIATFARIGEEFLALRAATPPGPDRDRIDRMIKLNQDTLAAVNRSLMITEGDIARAKHAG